MDANKLKKLREIGYTFKPSCMLCKHFTPGMDLWGTCKFYTYQHIKHTDQTRQLSVHAMGGCRKWERNTNIDPFGLAWFEFIER
jgi:hypothetical protein